MIRAWVRVPRADAASPLEGIQERLQREGIDAVQPHGSPLRGPGILFFDDLETQVAEWLRFASRGGLERVLAVSMTAAAVREDRIWSLLQAGASDVLVWGADTTRDIADRLKRWDEVDRLVYAAGRDGLVGRSPLWIAALRQIVEAASFTDLPILLTGESGTGKELLARLVHRISPRGQSKEMVVLDCTTIVPELSGSEFFGHERGAFTGAIASRAGAFALADRSTLFLDEIGDLPPVLQAELLRVVQEGTFKKVGSNSWERTDFRLVCATNRDLLAPPARATFRRDLYFRIAGCRCRVPSLRERTEDILPLVEEFLRGLNRDREPPALDESVRSYLVRRDYPGNTRDLKQLVARLGHRHVGTGPITLGAIPEDERRAGGVRDWRDAGFERAIRRALASGIGYKGISEAAKDVAMRLAEEEAGGNLQLAAERLGVSDRLLQQWRAEKLAWSKPTGGKHPA